LRLLYHKRGDRGWRADARRLRFYVARRRRPVGIRERERTVALPPSPADDKPPVPERGDVGLPRVVVPYRDDPDRRDRRHHQRGLQPSPEPPLRPEAPGARRDA